MEHARQSASALQRARSATRRAAIPRAAAPVVDHRPAAVAQRELAATITRSPRLVAQRQQFGGLFGSAGRAAARPVVQRYVDLPATDYTGGAGATFSSQQMVEAGGTARYEQTTTSLAGGAWTQQTRGVTGGTWGAPGAAGAAVQPGLRYSTDGVNAMAIQATAGEAKEFYATTAVKTASNLRLAQVGAAVRIEEAGGTINTPSNPALPHGPQLSLERVKPASTTPDPHHPGKFTLLDRFGDISECNSFVKYVVGSEAQRVAVFGAGAGSEAPAEEEKEPTREIADFAVNQPGLGAAGLATHLKPTPSGSHDAPLPVGYTAMAGKAARDQALGINASALADVGEGYVTTSNAAMPDDLPYERYLAALDNKTAGLPATADERAAFRYKWGYHYAGVVAKLGGDTVTLENYNRGTVMEWQLDKLYNDVLVQFNQFRAFVVQTLNDERAAGQPGNIPSIPKMRRQWFRDRATRWRQHVAAAGTAATLVNTQIEAALAAVDQAQAQGLALGNANLYYFKMYGSGAGQSFHEQWAGALDDSMTLRLRQSLPAMKTVKSDGLQARLAALHGLAMPTSLGAIASAHVRDGVAAIGLAADPATVSQAEQTAVTGLRDVRDRAIRHWGRKAAEEMGKPATAIPAGANAAAIAGIIDHWQTKGWAHRESSKRKLAARRAELGRLAGLVRAADGLAL